MTGADDAAIDHAGDHWHNLAARDRQHDFIQQREPFGPAVHPEENPRLRVPGERRHIRVPETSAYARCLLDVLECGGEVLRDEPLVAGGAEQEAVFDSIRAALVEQSPS